MDKNQSKPKASHYRKLETIILKLEMLSQEVPRESAQELIQAKSVLIRVKNNWGANPPNHPTTMKTQESKHTPGPWVHWPAGGHGHGIITDEKYARHLAVIVNGAPETEANAALIASAPDLLAALKGLLADGGPLSDPVSRKQAQDRARQALLKAERTGEGR